MLNHAHLDELNPTQQEWCGGRGISIVGGLYRYMRSVVLESDVKWFEGGNSG